jgi:RHS repeat-associated protein
VCAVSANAQTNGYGFSVNGGSNSTLSYDLNGNMLSDGTNSYSWDAENRMIKITYPGTNNFSSFVYDGLGKNVSIVETTAGSVTSTKQFVWSFETKPREARDGTGTLVNQYFVIGQLNVSTKYSYELNHLGSVVGMTDNSGNKVSDRSYDPFGRVIINSETLAPDFGYAGYYLHSRSGLNLTRTRAYDSALGRFINRDHIGEAGGINLFAYVSNDPIMLRDPSGLKKCDPCDGLAGWALFICKRNNDPCKGLWGWAMDICRGLNKNSDPSGYMPPTNVDPVQLYKDGAPPDIVDQRMKDIANGDLDEYKNQQQRLQLYLEQLRIDAENAEKRAKFQNRQQIIQ